MIMISISSTFKWLLKLVLIFGLSICLLASAILFLLFSTEYANHHKKVIETWASNIFEEPIVIQNIKIRNNHLMPTIHFDNVQLLDKKTTKVLLKLDSLDLELNLIQSLLNLKFIPQKILISGTKLSFVQNSDGSIILDGMSDQSNVNLTSKVVLKWILSQKNIELHSTDISFKNNKGKYFYLSLRNLNIYKKNIREIQKIKNQSSWFQQSSNLAMSNFSIDFQKEALTLPLQNSHFKKWLINILSEQTISGSVILNSEKSYWAVILKGFPLDYLRAWLPIKNSNLEFFYDEKSLFIHDLANKPTIRGIINFQNNFLAKFQLGNTDSQNFTKITIKQNSNLNRFTINILNKNIQGDLFVPQNLANSTIRCIFNKLDLDSIKSGTHHFNLNPKEIPAIELHINQVIYGKKNFGKVLATTKPSTSGLYIKNLSIITPTANLKAQGTWAVLRNKNHTSLQGTIFSQNLGNFLKNLNLATNLENGIGNIIFNIDWNDTPFNPNLQTIIGNVRFKFSRGRIIGLSQKVESGLNFGRFLNILSLQPYFSQGFEKKGFPFDSLAGAFQLTKNNILLQYVKMNGDLAVVNVIGRIGLLAKDYDLKLIILPNITGSLPTAAAITTGPVVGAAIWLADKVVGSQVKKISASTYYIHGPWSNPIIDKKAYIPKRQKN